MCGLANNGLKLKPFSPKEHAASTRIKEAEGAKAIAPPKAVHGADVEVGKPTAAAGGPPVDPLVEVVKVVAHIHISKWRCVLNADAVSQRLPLSGHFALGSPARLRDVCGRVQDMLKMSEDLTWIPEA